MNGKKVKLANVSAEGALVSTQRIREEQNSMHPLAMSSDCPLWLTYQAIGSGRLP